MDTHIKGVFKRRILLSLTAAICISVFVITFGNNKNIPTWGDLARLFGFYPSHSLSDDYIRVLDVGQGDGILISSNGKTALVDTGPPEMQQTICDKLKANGAKNLDAVLITHYHIDHVGGLDNVANNFSLKI